MADPKPISTKAAMKAIPGCQVLCWFQHPQSPDQPLPSGSRLEEWDGSHLYRMDGQTIGVDVKEVVAQVYQCTRNDADMNFSEGEGVLNCEADPLTNLVHLRFNPPVRAVGTHVTGHWTDGRKYMVSFIVVLEDGTKCAPFAVAAQGTFSTKRDTAPFVGAKASAGNLISEMYCDIYPTGRIVIDSEADVAIGNLYYVKA